MNRVPLTTFYEIHFQSKAGPRYRTIFVLYLVVTIVTTESFRVATIRNWMDMVSIGDITLIPVCISYASSPMVRKPTEVFHRNAHGSIPFPMGTGIEFVMPTTRTFEMSSHDLI
jgi:hypothetical protein